MMIGHYNDTPRGGVLLRANGRVTAMPYSTAVRAMERTARYANERGFKWRTSEQRLILLEGLD
jgi:hypothetical protein